MRKLISVLTAALVLAACAVSAFADVIWTPEDDFYTKHADECTDLNRSYYANSPEGHVGIYTEPDGNWLADAQNGARLSVSFTYDAFGTTWGLVEHDVGTDPKNYLNYADGKTSSTGWVDMEQLTLIYDTQSFTDEYGADFTAYDGKFDTLLSSDDQRVIVWTYPGSGEINTDFAALDPAYAEKMEIDEQWTDAGGRVWGSVSYYMGARGWVCLSDPGNETLPVTEHAYDLYPAVGGESGGDSSSIATPAETGDSTLPALIFAVSAICGITGLLLIFMSKKRTGGEGTES